MCNQPTIMTFHRFGIPFLAIVFLSLTGGSTPPKSKRQIYREQVLPSRGGKIPDAAFTSDRLALNRLNKEGISVPDGVLLEHRNVYNHPHIRQHDPEDEDSLIKIVQRPENRYVAPSGKYQNKAPFTVPSTYIIRKPVGVEDTGIRTPLQQVSIHEHLSQQQGNQIYQPYSNSYYQQSYTSQYIPPQLPEKYLPPELIAPQQNYIPVDSPSLPQKYLPLEVPVTPQKYVPAPPQKYLPTDAPAPPQKYLPVEVSAFPHKYISILPPSQKYVEVSSPQHKYLPPELSAPSPTIVHHPPTSPYKYKPPPVSYQQIQHSVAYYPITVPLQIPNKEVLKDEYYNVKNKGNTYGNQDDSEDIHSVVNWPSLLGQYTRLSDSINALDHDSYVRPNPHSVYYTPQVLGSVDSSSRYYTTRDRYARKSKEISFTETMPEPEKPRSKDGQRLIKLKCTSRLENTVEDGSTQCFVRY